MAFSSRVRRSSQLGIFQPKGRSEISDAKKSFAVVSIGGQMSPAESIIRIISIGIAKCSSFSHKPSEAIKVFAGCKNAVVRRSAPSSFD